MSKTLEKILEDELFKIEKFEGLGSLSIKNTSKDSKMQIAVAGNSYQEVREGYNKFDETWSNGYFTSDAGVSSSSLSGCHADNYIEIGDNKTIYVLINVLQDCLIGRLYMMEFDENYTAVKRRLTPSIYDSTLEAGVHKYTVNLSENCKYIKPSIYVLHDAEGNSLTPLKDYYGQYLQICISDNEVEKYEKIGKAPTLEYLSPNESCGDKGNISVQISDNTEQEQNISIPVQEPFKAMKGYSDTFNFRDGKWYEKRYIKRRIFTGDENFSMTYGDSLFSLGGIRNQSTTNHFAICNGFQFNTITSAMNNLRNGYFAMQYVQSSIFFKCEECATADDFKAKLKELYEAGTPLYVDYTVEEPEEVECTEEQTKILNKLQQILSYDDITQIICTDEIQCNFTVTAKISKIKKLEEQINAQIGV